jgi:NAD(P)-dependent dehydrogenase (short-subunit alcohol dehydrogenase family)
MATSTTLAGRTVLVTGASSGIGRQCCVEIAAAGGVVVATGRNADRLDATVRSLGGGGHFAMIADLTDEGKIDEVAKRCPALDGVVLAAGSHKYLPFKLISRTAMRAMMAVNFEAPVLLAQELLRERKINSGGSIVFIVSLAGVTATKGNAVYGGAKAALIAAARVLAIELAPQRIRVNCVAPGIVATPMSERMASSISPEQMKLHEAHYPLGFGVPADVSSAVGFLLSDGGRWITGQTLILDGGYSAQ